MRRRMIPWVGMIVFVAGCSSGYGQVEGKVTFKGKPLAGAAILFVPQRGPAAAGAVGEDGSYRLLTKRPGDGAVVGPCKVAIVAPDPKKPLPIPKKYLDAEASGLTAEVKEGQNTIHFDIPES
jgi:hypothetical protein